MKPKVSIIGDGNVGSALRDGLRQKGYEAQAVGRDPERVQALARDGDVVVLAVPFGERQNAIRAMGDGLRGKVLVDVTNALTDEHDLAVEPTRGSGAEEVASWAEGARVVKAFNTVFAKHMATGKANGETLTLFVAGDDANAKDLVRDMGRDLGFDAVDAGPLRNARWIETLGFFHIELAKQGLGPLVEFKLVR